MWLVSKAAETPATTEEEQPHAPTTPASGGPPPSSSYSVQEPVVVMKEHSESSSSLQLTIPAAEEPLESSEPLDWPEALLDTCRAQGTLSVSLLTIIKHHDRLRTRPRRNDGNVVVWKPAAITAIPCARFIQQTPQGSDNASSNQPSTLGRVFRGASSAVHSALSYLAAAGDEDLVSLENQPTPTNEEDENDHAFCQEEEFVDWKERLVCLELVQECIESIVKDMEQQKEVQIFDNAAWASYCRRAVNSSVVSLKNEDVDLLAHVVVELGYAQQHNDPPLMILRPRHINPLTTSQLESQVALHQLQQAIDATEHQIETWKEGMDDLTRNAARHKAKGDCKTALHLLQRRRIYQEKVDLAQASLLNLSQAQLALTSATTNTHTLSALQATTEALRELRLDQGNTPQIMEDYQEELDQVPTLPPVEALTGLAQEEDDALLQELENMVLEEKTEHLPANAAEGKTPSIESSPVSDLPVPPSHPPGASRRVAVPESS